MSWNTGAAVSGAGLSAGALLADAGSPSADDTDWEDSTTRDAAHANSATSAIALGVYVGGVDYGAQVLRASWDLGQSEPLALTVVPSSATLELRWDPADTPPAVGARVAILTDWDVLWVGTVEGHDETTEAIGATSFGVYW